MGDFQNGPLPMQEVVVMAVRAAGKWKPPPICLCKHKGKWVGIVKVGGHEIVLQKMFAQMKPPVNVKCEYVEISGTDLKTGEKRKERITP